MAQPVRGCTVKRVLTPLLKNDYSVRRPRRLNGYVARSNICQDSVRIALECRAESAAPANFHQVAVTRIGVQRPDFAGRKPHRVVPLTVVLDSTIRRSAGS
jgi:hypothetical protein